MSEITTKIQVNKSPILEIIRYRAIFLGSLVYNGEFSVGVKPMPHKR